MLEGWGGSWRGDEVALGTTIPPLTGTDGAVVGPSLRSGVIMQGGDADRLRLTSALRGQVRVPAIPPSTRAAAGGRRAGVRAPAQGGPSTG